ncbi:thymocyte nuclear protein 1 [Rhypophila decipiens]|uniref:Thymocyte nuclear protein 1 n=1 Tax=Rhypophila decipiens TaxID=261697 RepID=A0AAN6Y1S9_9PEZI|nr:thymocyte nuclear protein 1 [Rhypophila decipiens]
MPKRKSTTVAEVAAPSRRRSLRLSSGQSLQDDESATTTPVSVEPSSKKEVEASEPEPAAEEVEESSEPPAKRSRTSRTQKQIPTSKKSAQGAKPTSNESENTSSTRNYWLLKAEPETRLENGKDVSFSIDDLASKTEPEPWDGIRNYVARNNLRAMKKGDLAFFYHSNCKEPGIVGTMEIVREHEPDLSAHDSKAPYYDPKSKPADPKWSVVHVEFRSKFAEPIGLKELRTMGDGPGKPLANMQLLKQSRLSVSKVSSEEWEYLIGVAESRGKVITKK